MFKHFSCCALLLLLLCTACSSVQQSPASQRTVRINLGNDPNALDPRKARDLFSQSLARMFFDGLTRFGKNEKAELALAESVSFSSDLKTYTFRLKETKWSNGDSVTAHDFVYAWKTLLDPQFPSDTGFNLYSIKNAKAAKEGKVSLDQIGARALDEKTLEVELEYPVPYFLELTSVPAFFPVNARVDQSNPHWAESPSSFVCNGPFCLEIWKHSDRILAAKNLSYWDASAVHLPQVELVMVTEDTELRMFEKNELDWAGSPFSRLPVEALASLRKEKRLKTKELLGTSFFRVNTEVCPLNDVMIRKALSLAINRKEIIDHITQGNQIPALGLVPLSFGLQEAPYFQDGNIHEARRQFNEALARLKLEVKTFPEITLLYASSELNHLIAQAVEQQWYKALGIRIKLESCERKVYFDRISKQDYQLASSSWTADFNDPINFLDVFRYKKGNLNNTHWGNAEYTDLLTRSETMSDPKVRIQILKRCEKLLMEEMPILPLYHYTMLYVQHPRLKDVVVSSLGVMDLKWADIQ